MDFEMILKLLGLAIFSFLLTWVIIRVARKLNVIDMPNHRSSHTTPTPRGGGLAIVLSWYLGLTYLFISDEINRNLFYALLSGGILGVISLIDDMVSLSPRIRMITQIVVASTGVYFLGGLGALEIMGFLIQPNILMNILAVLGIVWFINLFNFLDGIDAYASLEAIFIATAIFIFVGNPLLLVLIASIIGFLIWNWPKAKIFMGDIGSTQLGYVLVILGVYFNKTSELSILTWLVLSSLFWFDASYTLYRRFRNKEKLSEAHKKHAYQRIVQAGFSHLKTDAYSIGINILILGLAYLSYTYNKLTILALAISVLLLFGVTSIIDKRKPF